MIAVSLVGRIGNQLFIYAAAEAIRQKRGRNEKIVFYDYPVLDKGWRNSLLDYDLENVEYEHNPRKRLFISKLKAFVLSRFFYSRIGCANPWRVYQYERKLQPIWNKLGIVSCTHGYLEMHTPSTSHVFVRGYLQSEKYFKEISLQIRHTLMKRLPVLRKKDYVKQLENRNSVCISIKVEHNAGDTLFDVCGKEYYTQAITYITKMVENPLFFICSDNVQYVLEHYIDADKYDCICQEQGLPVSDALTIMGACKHYIIGNTSFGWWAQYLSANLNKIVVAPNRWFRDVNMPVDIYDENWHLIDVTGYIERTNDNYE